MSPGHLVRRAVGSFRNNPLTTGETGVARSVLLPGEFDLWLQMQNRDRRHSLDVLRRFDRLAPGADREDRAAALLHDVGKASSPLGWWGRIIATVAGPRTAAMRAYLDHEAIGVGVLQGVSTPRTIAVLDGTAADASVEALRAADNV